MKVIQVLNLNENGVRVEKEDNPMTISFFDDNSGLPSGNFNEDNIEGLWLHVEGKHKIGTYAYREIDNSTLLKLES